MKTEHLITVGNYASKKGCTTQHIYRQIKEGKVPSVEIDGVKFVDLSKIKE
jgi:predicted DNA-binding transcriptional regulator AlpA